MNHLIFGGTYKDEYPVALLVPSINKERIQDAYLKPYGLNGEDMIVLSTFHEGKKTPADMMKQYIEEELIPVWDDYNIQYILCANSDYFKILTKAKKVEANLGYVMDCAYGDQKVIYVPDYKAIFYDPEKVHEKIALGMNALAEHRSGTYTPPGNGIIKFAAYPQTDSEIEQWLEKLLAMDIPLSVDIEAFSLKHYDAGIGTITFCWSETEGIAFPVDYVPIKGATEAPFGTNKRNNKRRKLLRSFFERFEGKLTYHSIGYDVTVLIYQLFMDHILDIEGKLQGLEVMLKNWDCSKLITYLATNSCSGNHLSLKDQGQEYSGNYAMGDDIKDITKIPLEKLLEYNLIDGLTTNYVKKKHWDTMINDHQYPIYKQLFQPSMVDIIDMQLTGMPVNRARVDEVANELNQEEQELLHLIGSNPVIQNYNKILKQQIVDKKNAEYKKKRITIADVNDVFNPNSGPQLQDLLFEYLKLPVLNLTESKQPSTDGETLEGLINRVEDGPIKELLENLQVYKIVTKLTSSFIPALQSSVQGPDGWYYLFGSFNLGGTLSGRLSSSDPNLQNLPSTGKGKKLNAKYAKLIKSCFQAPPGYIFGGIDFSSLEDRISALTTKDPNKLKVYTDGYDGHSLRAFAYFGNQMPDIDGNSVESINSIQVKYKPLRDRSKNPTFTLTYQGTKHALIKKYGFTEEQAEDLEIKYHELYKVSDDWVNAQLDQAMKDGFITAAFGLRLRTPLLKQVIRGTSKTPYAAEAEGRTAGNALGQSWCLLNSRAGNEFNQKVRASKHRLNIRPCAQIHDAQYFIIKDDIEAIMYTNEHLVKAVQWQDHPAIWHDQVKLGGEMSIFYPNWCHEIVIPNNATKQDIFDIIEKAVKE